MIERPASVVKELVENSIDAGADNIKIIFDSGGRNFISIKDNGKGMSKDDLHKSILRHATSKLDESDISNICHFGFRGEALASISSVSRLKIASNHSESNDIGWKLETEGSSSVQISPDAIAEGTLIEVRDLFYSTPVRLKFLKSERAENSEITDIVTKIALANLNISFSLILENKTILDVKAVDESSMLKRIGDLFSQDYVKNLAQVTGESDFGKVYGYASMPTFNKGVSNEIYIFINKRPVKDKVILSAIKSAYQDFLAPNRYPVIFLMIDLNHHEVDVNVHPTKSEVRFREAAKIRSLVYNALRQAILSTGKETSTTIASDFINQITKAQTTKPQTNYVAPSRESVMESFKVINTLYSQPKSGSEEPELSSLLSQKVSNFVKPISNEINSEGEGYYQEPLVVAPLIEDKDAGFRLGVAKAQLMDTYIVAENSNGIIIVDQHAAHERLVYEDLKSKILNKDLTSQHLAFPSDFKIGPEVAEFLESNRSYLSELGIVFELLDDVLRIKSIPVILEAANLEFFIENLIEDFNIHGQDMSIKESINHILATHACHHSVRSGRKLNLNEMNSLLRQMENTSFSGQCNHGRPTYIELNIKDIEKLFGRR